MHAQLEKVEQARKRLKTISYKDREEALARIRQGKFGEAEELLTAYFNGSIEAYALGTDIVTNLVSCALDPEYGFQKNGCLELLERIAAGQSKLSASIRKGEAMYVLRELGEKFHYAPHRIRRLGDEFNKNNPIKEYSLASLVYTHSTEDKKEVIRVEFEQSRAA